MGPRVHDLAQQELERPQVGGREGGDPVGGLGQADRPGLAPEALVDGRNRRVDQQELSSPSAVAAWFSKQVKK